MPIYVKYGEPGATIPRQQAAGVGPGRADDATA
jgi:hypothetical protein